jgi:membrane dipeptidase|tara:strand:+ start:4468 stop:5739 length:1272 start_codon:yes stop_codon:yes gene_type:complete
MYSKSIAKITAQLATPGRLAKVLSSIGLTACVVGLSACAEPPKTGAELAQSLLIIDTHIDVPYRLKLSYADVSRATDSGDFDYPRAIDGGLNAPFMSIYIPAKVDEAGGAFALADELIDGMESLAASAPNKFAIATCSDDLQNHFENNLISLPLGMENGGPVTQSEEALVHFFNRGIRYITLAHSKSNKISDSSYDTNEVWMGLSPYGKELITRMNDLGVMIDVSHISDAAFEQVIETSKAPVIASHSSLRHYTPGFVRNMSDDMVKTLGAAKGVIQINFGTNFLTSEAQIYSKQRREVVMAYIASEGITQDDPAVKAFAEQYKKDNPYPFATTNDVLDHIGRVVELAGIDAVGIGSDYDGVGDSLPQGLKDVSTYPNLIEGLLGRGYSEADIAKVLGGNALRVWREVEAYAASQGTAAQCRT